MRPRWLPGSRFAVVRISRGTPRFFEPLRSPLHVAGIFALLACAAWLGFERSGWILVTQPVEALHSANLLLGYSYLYDRTILHKENWSSFVQIAYFGGADIAPDLYFRRPAYTYVASLLSPALGMKGSLVALNVLGWLVAICLCHRFTASFCESNRAAWWASLLAMAGIGFSIHLLDLSAHLFSFVLYMAGVTLLWESRVWCERLTFRAHVAIGLFLAIACLQYNTGVALVAAYVLLALRRNATFHVASASAIALAAPAAWDLIVKYVFEQRHGTPLPTLAATELAYLDRAVLAWAEVFQRPLPEMAGASGRLALQFLGFESPVVLALAIFGVLGFARTSWGRERLAFAMPLLLLPFAAAFLFSTAARARGYLVYGTAIFPFAACGWVLARLIQRDRFVFVPVGVAVAIFSLAWSTAHFWNLLGPAKAYFLGMEHARGLFHVPAWEAENLTGLEPLPRLFGGNADLGSAGLTHELPRTQVAPARNFGYALMASAIFIVLFAAWLAIGARKSWRVILLSTVALCTIAWLNSRESVGSLAVESFDQVAVSDARRALTYEIDLDASARQRLSRGLSEGYVPLFFCPFAAAFPPRVRIGERDIGLDPLRSGFLWRMDVHALSEALSSGGDVLRVRFAPAVDTRLAGWLAPELPGRRLRFDGAHEPPHALPGVELRLVRDVETMSPIWIGY